MICNLTIDNFALIQHADINFEKGLNIITGETGSGKSMMATAMSLALGARADSTFIRHGAEKTVVSLDIKIGDITYNIQREVTSSGKNTCIINGEKVSLARLQTLCNQIVRIHGQFDNQGLLNPQNHLDFLDTYGGESLHIPLRKYQDAYENYESKKKAYEELLALERENLRQEEFYRFSMNEIKAANIKKGEEAELKKQLKLMKNSEQVASALQAAYKLLYEQDDSASSLLGAASSSLNTAEEFIDNELIERLNTATYEIEDIGSTIGDLLRDLNFSTEDIDALVERLDQIRSIQKKYGTSYDEIMSFYDDICHKLELIDNLEDEKKRLKAELDEASDIIEAEAENITSIRRNYANKLEHELETAMKELAFTHAKLDIKFERGSYGIKGQDIVEIYISTNKGELPLPLSKVASGGEAARIMLAFSSIIAHKEAIGTLIFDEIDTGISGRAAAVVGRRLKALGVDKQIISITHLPQIAAMGDVNFKISKSEDDENTYTHIRRLEGDDRVYEIATLLSGENISDTTLASARELMKQNI